MAGIVSAAYVVAGDEPTVFKVKETLGATQALADVQEDFFEIYDSAGKQVFDVAAKPISLHDRRRLLDHASGDVVASIGKKFLTLRETYTISNADGDTIASIREPNLTLKEDLKVWLKDSDRDADLAVRGDLRGKHFDVVDLASGRELGSIKKESRFSGIEAFLRTTFSDKDSYYVEVLPGTDAALILSLALLVDELLHDKGEKKEESW